MRVDKVGEYRMSNGQRAVVNTISSGRAYGWIMDGYWFTGSSFWYCGDGSHPTQSGLQIVSKWVAANQHDDDLRLIVARTLGRLQGLQRYRMESAWIGSPMMVEAAAGEWLEAGDVQDAIEELRRAIGDCTLDEEGS